MIVVPNRVFPNQVVQVQVTFFKMYHQYVNVRVTIHKKGEEWASLSAKFTEPSTRFLQMRVSILREFICVFYALILQDIYYFHLA